MRCFCATMTGIFLFLLLPVAVFGASGKDRNYPLADDVIFYNPDSGKPIALGPINADTVEGFELLYATPGTGDAAEIAGHLVLRIKLDNNPRAGKRGIENPYDLVVSFLADTSDGDPSLPSPEKALTIQPECRKNWLNLVNNQNDDEDAFESILQSLKGLSGGFLTIMDRQTLAYTIKSYTVEQDRDLLRFRLKLTPLQKRNLLERLYQAKNAPGVKYYFFSQNCASVLVDVVSQGIGDTYMENFHPLVSPPNTLLAILLQRGVIEPVYPSFYSCRKKGYISQNMIREELASLTQKFPHDFWPDISDLVGKNEDKRHISMIDLRRVAKDIPDSHADIYRLAVLSQEAEMAYSYKDMLCENYTSPVTAEARSLQKYLLASGENRITDFSVDVDRLMDHAYLKEEKRAFLDGYSHTGHYEMTLGTGYIRDSLFDDAPVLLVGGALHHQEMGSSSHIAMQRGSYVDLGKFSLSAGYGLDKEELILKRFEITGLRIRKFRDRLGQIPSVFGPFASFGLGLNLMDMEGSGDAGFFSGSIAGIESLLSVYSTKENDNYLYVSAGADIVTSHQKDKKGYDVSSGTAWGIGIPVGLENLMTFSPRRNLRMRNQVMYHLRTTSDISDIFSICSTVEVRLNNTKRPEIVLKCGYGYKKQYASRQFPEDRETNLFLLSADIHYW